MKHLFNYCMFRIANAYKKMHMRDYVGQGYFLMFVSLTFYALALTECALSLFDRKINVIVIICFSIPTIVEVLFFERLFPNSNKIFKKYYNKYCNDRFRWIKGIFVCLFVVMSLTCYIIALIHFELK